MGKMKELDIECQQRVDDALMHERKRIAIQMWALIAERGKCTEIQLFEAAFNHLNANEMQEVDDYVEEVVYFKGGE